MVGSNWSTSLKDTQHSILVGALATIATTTAMYWVSILVTREGLVTETLAWPMPALIYIGIILSTLGATLQSLIGPPRLLVAIANDDILPILKYFKATNNVEPHLTTLFIAFNGIACVVLGNPDLIWLVIAMFSLLCYVGVNLSCFLLDLLNEPSWRPRWKFHR
eukprot:Gb_14499 [translate_table: standard]